MRPTGSVVSPTSGSLEAMVYQEEKDEYLATLRRSNNTASFGSPGSNNVVLQLPDRAPEMPGYVPSNGAVKAANSTADTTANKAADTTADTTTGETVSANTEPKAENIPVSNPAVNLKPIETNIRTLDIGQALAAGSDQGNKTVETRKTSLRAETLPAPGTVAAEPKAEFMFGAELPEMARGAKVIIPVLVKSAMPFKLAILALKYDDQKVAVRSITYGDIFGSEQAKSSAIPYLNKGGKMFVSLNPISPIGESGILAYIEIEALADGKPQISFDGEAMNVLSSGGANFALNFK
jgi:hypothetical protein